MSNNEITCLSCNKTIKSYNLRRHSKSKRHILCVNSKVDRMINRVNDKKVIRKHKINKIF